MSTEAELRALPYAELVDLGHACRDIGEAQKIARELNRRTEAKRRRAEQGSLLGEHLEVQPDLFDGGAE